MKVKKFRLEALIYEVLKYPYVGSFVGDSPFGEWWLEGGVSRKKKKYLKNFSVVGGE